MSYDVSYMTPKDENRLTLLKEDTSIVRLLFHRAAKASDAEKGWRWAS